MVVVPALAGSLPNVAAGVVWFWVSVALISKVAAPEPAIPVVKQS